MAIEKGKERPDAPASREADPRNLETSAAVSGDNDIDRIITQPDDGAKEATDEAYFDSGSAEKTEGSDRDVKEQKNP